MTVGALAGCVACGTTAGQPARPPRWDVVEAQVADLSPGYRRDMLTFAADGRYGGRYGGAAAVWVDKTGRSCTAQLAYVEVTEEGSTPSAAAVVAALPLCAAVSGTALSVTGEEG